jgi:hypothetical protein
MYGNSSIVLFLNVKEQNGSFIKSIINFECDADNECIIGARQVYLVRYHKHTQKFCVEYNLSVSNYKMVRVQNCGLHLINLIHKIVT